MFSHSREEAIAELRFAIPPQDWQTVKRKIGAEVTPMGRTRARPPDAQCVLEIERRGTCRRTLQLPFMGDIKRGAFDGDNLRAQRIAAAAKRFARHG